MSPEICEFCFLEKATPLGAKIKSGEGICTPPSPSGSALSTLRETSLLVEDLASVLKPVPAIPSLAAVFVEATPGVCVCARVCVCVCAPVCVRRDSLVGACFSMIPGSCRAVSCGALLGA